jgi:hypothetical protein
MNLKLSLRWYQIFLSFLLKLNKKLNFFTLELQEGDRERGGGGEWGRGRVGEGERGRN